MSATMEKITTSTSNKADMIVMSANSDLLHNRHTLKQIDDDVDDDCVICYQTLYRPAKTLCQHMACESCMLQWALTAMETTVGAADLPSNIGLAVEGIKFKCPTCRTYTKAKFDNHLDKSLAAKYPDEYIQRAAEESKPLPSTNEDGVETMFAIYGNSHRKVTPYTTEPYISKPCEHEWTFFIQSSRNDVIELVHVILHPLFREQRLVTLEKAPFSTTHPGWSPFSIYAGLQLKEGYQWVDEDRAVDSDANNGRIKDKLPIEWSLDFSSNGSQKNKILKFKKTELKEKSKEDLEDDLGVLALLLSESELRELREVRRLKALAGL